MCYRHQGREAHIRCQRCGRNICPDCMRPAAVGFQCPECVREGAKSTRAGRATYGGKPSANPVLTSQVLIGINAAVWLLIMVTGASSSRWVDRLALLPRGRCQIDDGSGRFIPALSEGQCMGSAALDWVPGVSDGAVWQLVTSMFTHVDIWHVGFNMLALWFLGPQLEAAVGRARFLALYLLSGLVGSALVYWLAGEHTATLGASGAIFGLMGGLLVVGHKMRADVSQLFLWIGLNFLVTVVGRSFISWQGHLGGFIGGVLVAGIVVYAPRRNRPLWQWSALCLLAVLLVVALAVRTATL